MFKRRPLSPQEQLHSVAHRYRWLRYSQAGQRQVGHTTGSSASIAQGGSRPTCDPRLQRLEAILFLAREPVSARKLSKHADLADATEARTLVRQLNQIYQVCQRFRSSVVVVVTNPALTQRCQAIPIIRYIWPLIKCHHLPSPKPSYPTLVS